MGGSRKKTILAIGQDLFSIESYLTAQYNFSLQAYLRQVENFTASDYPHHRLDRPPTPPSLRDVTPPVFMVYTDLQSLRGLDRPADYGSGIEFADGIAQLVSASTASATRRGGGKKKKPHLSSSSSSSEATPFLGLQVGLWLNGTEGCRDIVDGRLDPQIVRLVSYLSSGRGGGGVNANPAFDKIWVRIGYEFDNPSFGYIDDPVSYRKAFRRIVGACRAIEGCRRRATFVWHSWAASLSAAKKKGGGDEKGNATTSLRAYYPGDDAVDWVGLSIFSQLYPDEPGFSRLGDVDTVREVLRFAQERGKPVMIAESTPFGGIPSRTDPWETWFRPVLDLIDEYGVSMWSYIHCDWESQPMWFNVGFGDTRLDSNATVSRLWRENVLDNPRFISSQNDWDADERAPSEAADMARLGLSQHWKLAANEGPMPLSPLYFLPAIVIALLAMCARVCCSSSPMRNPYTGLYYWRGQSSGRRSSSHDEVASSATDDDPTAPIDPTHCRTGYGTLVTK